MSIRILPTMGVIDRVRHLSTPPKPYMVKNAGYDMVSLAVKGLIGLSFG